MYRFHLSVIYSSIQSCWKVKVNSGGISTEWKLECRLHLFPHLMRSDLVALLICWGRQHVIDYGSIKVGRGGMPHGVEANRYGTSLRCRVVPDRSVPLSRRVLWGKSYRGAEIMEWVVELSFRPSYHSGRGSPSISKMQERRHWRWDFQTYKGCTLVG